MPRKDYARRGLILSRAMEPATRKNVCNAGSSYLLHADNNATFSQLVKEGLLIEVVVHTTKAGRLVTKWIMRDSPSAGRYAKYPPRN